MSLDSVSKAPVTMPGTHSTHNHTHNLTHICIHCAYTQMHTHMCMHHTHICTQTYACIIHTCATSSLPSASNFTRHSQRTYAHTHAYRHVYASYTHVYASYTHAQHHHFKAPATWPGMHSTAHTCIRKHTVCTHMHTQTYHMHTHAYANISYAHTCMRNHNKPYAHAPPWT